MNADSYVSVAIAVLCVVALGVSATTLESSLSTDPDDVIDLDWEQLPISQEDAADVQSEMESGQDSSEGDGDGGGGSSDESDGGASAESGGSETTQVQEQREQQQQEQQEQQQQEPSDPQNPNPDADSFMPGQTTIWDMLLDALPWLVALAWLAAVGALLYRYRERVLALVAAALHSGSDAGDADDGDEWPAVEPADEVDRLWLAMARRLDVDDPESTTPAEFAREAVRAGMDPDGVRTLTDAFEEVRYGGAGVTEDRKRRAREGYRKLGLDDGDERPADGRGRPSRTDGGESR